MPDKKMNIHPDLINTHEAIDAIAGQLAQEALIAFDTEFIRETTFFPKIEILQIATTTDSWLIDAHAFKEHGPNGLGQFQPLLEIFTNERILKVVHAAQGDQECLFTSFGITAKPSLDTAIAAALCGYGDGIGLGNLLKATLGISIKKGLARTNWSARPLPAHLKEYAHQDVLYLLPVAHHLLKELDQLGRKNWALELSALFENSKLYEQDPQSIAEKIARNSKFDPPGYCVLLELVKWREMRVRHLNIPRRWVADDQVLIDIARTRPKDLDHLATFRGLNKGELKASGTVILAAIEKGNQSTEIKIPPAPSVDLPTPGELQTIDLIRCFVGLLAEQHRIASKYLLNSAQALSLLRSQSQDPQDWVDRGILSQNSEKLIGKELFSFLHGKLALAVDYLNQPVQIKTVELS